MSVLIGPIRISTLRRNPAAQPTRSSFAVPLTLKCASVIVRASIEERPRAQDDPHVRLPYLDYLSWRRGSPRRCPYNLRTTSL